jgi:hypothetical protein
VSVILNTATGGRSIGHNAAIAVGSTVALLGLFASPISGASMNPARTLGPDIVGNDYTGWWVYVAGPVLGAAIAVAIIGLVRDCRTRRSVKQPRAAPCRSLAPSPRPRTATEKAGRRRQLPTGIGDEHVGARSGAFGPEIIAQPGTGWAVILFMPGLPPPGAPGCSPSRPGRVTTAGPGDLIRGVDLFHLEQDQPERLDALDQPVQRVFADSGTRS